MLAKVHSIGVLGIEGYPVEVEVDISEGLPSFSIVGLPDPAVRESVDRVRSALKNSGFTFPLKRITVNLAPCDVKKEGPSFDLPIAVGILLATGQLEADALSGFVFCGELALDGGLRPISGILPKAVAVGKIPGRGFVVPKENAFEAAIVQDISVYAMKTLMESVRFLRHDLTRKRIRIDIEKLWKENGHHETLDFRDVKGQPRAKRALEVAVAGGHNLLMIGPPGSGKTMLAKRIPTIMPELTLEEAIEVTKIHSVAGTLPIKNGFVSVRPFRAPHHTSSNIALVGGGTIPQPGEISLSHQGVLFLDELPEFHRDCLESLRQPLEEGSIRISRIRKSFAFPASFMLVCAMNPCPCGYYTDTKKACRCSPTKIQNYMSKISGPLLDRIDMHIELPSLKYKELTDTRDTEPSKVIKERVEKARAIQRERFKAEGIFYNAQMNTKLIKEYGILNEEAKELLKMAMTELGLSARAYDKILKVSRTIADLLGSEIILTEHISEAIQYRSLDRQWWI